MVYAAAAMPALYGRQAPGETIRADSLKTEHNLGATRGDILRLVMPSGVALTASV